MKKLKKLLSTELESVFNLKHKKITGKEIHKELQILLNSSLQEQDYKEYLELTVIKELNKIEDINNYNNYYVSLKKIKNNVFCYDEKTNGVYKSNIYRLTIKIKV